MSIFVLYLLIGVVFAVMSMKSASELGGNSYLVGMSGVCALFGWPVFLVVAVWRSL